MKKTNGLHSVLLAFAGLLATMQAIAQTYPQGQKSGPSGTSSGALVTLAIPIVVGVNTGHNFVLDFTSTTKCWGSTGSGVFPQQASGNTTYTFAVATAPLSSGPVGCPGANGQSDLALVQVISTAPTNSRLQASISDGGNGGATKFTDVITDIFSANRLQLTIPGGDTCGGGSKSSLTLQTTAANEVTGIPATGWSNCQQTLSLTLASTTTVKNGTATGILTFTMVNP